MANITISETNISLDLQHQGFMNTIYSQEGDSDSRQLIVSLYDNGAEYTIGDSCSVYLAGTRSDDATVHRIVDDFDENKVTIVFRNEELCTKGTQNYKIEISDDDAILSTFPFKVRVYENVYDEDGILASPQYGELQDALDSVQDVLDNAQETLDSVQEFLDVEKLSDITPILGTIDCSIPTLNMFVDDTSGTIFYPLSVGGPYWKATASSLSSGALYLGSNGSSGSTKYEGYIFLNNKKRGDDTSSISSNGIYLYGDAADPATSTGIVTITCDYVSLYSKDGYYNTLNSGKVEVNNSSGWAIMSPTQLNINGSDLFYVTDDQLNYKSGLLQILSTKMQYTGTSLVMDNITSATIGNTESETPTVYIGKTVEVSSSGMKVNQGGLTVNSSFFQVASTVSAAPIYASNIWLGKSTSNVTCSGNSFLCDATTTRFVNSVIFSGDVSLIITDSHIDDNSISGEKITDGTITYAKMADGFADRLLTDETYVSNTESIIANTSTLTADDPIVENLSALISVSGGLSYTIVDSTDSINLTVANADSYVYMVSNANGVDGNLYDEYMVIDGAIEKVGDWSIDLNDYATKTYVDNAIDGYITTSGISATTTGTGNVITSASYDSATGITTYSKDITALTESDIADLASDVETIKDTITNLSVGDSGSSAISGTTDFDAETETLSITFGESSSDSDYSLPIATTSSLGGVIVGDGLNVDDTGLVSVDFSSLTTDTETASAVVDAGTEELTDEELSEIYSE